MLSSWFGSFKARTGPGGAGTDGASGGGTMSQPPLSDSEAIRANLSRTRADLKRAAPMVTVLDPMQRCQPSPASALALATASACERVDMRSMSGRRRVGQVERVAVPLGGPGVVKVYAVAPDVPAAEARSIGLAMAERSHMTAVLLGPDGAGQEAALQGMCRAVARPSWECPHLLFLVQGDPQAAAQAIESMDWPGTLRLQWLETRPGPQALWQGLTQAWAPQTIAVPPAPPAAPTRPAAMPATPRPPLSSLDALAADPTVLGLALVDLFNGRVKQNLLGEPAALDTVAQDMGAAWALQAPLADFDQGAPAELLLLRQQGLQWLRPCGQPRGLALLLVLRPGADLDRMRQDLLHLDLNGAFSAAPPAPLATPAAAQAGSTEGDEFPTVPMTY